MAQNTQKHSYSNTSEMVLRAILLISVPLVMCSEVTETNVQMESPKVSWPDPNLERDRRQVRQETEDQGRKNEADRQEEGKNYFETEIAKGEQPRTS